MHVDSIVNSGLKDYIPSPHNTERNCKYTALARWYCTLSILQCKRLDAMKRLSSRSRNSALMPKAWAMLAIWTLLYDCRSCRYNGSATYSFVSTEQKESRKYLCIGLDTHLAHVEGSMGSKIHVQLGTLLKHSQRPEQRGVVAVVQSLNKSSRAEVRH
jgi:hypothetical protein